MVNELSTFCAQSGTCAGLSSRPLGIASSTANYMRRALTILDFFAFVPLLVFLAVAEFHPARFPDRWVYAYSNTFLPAMAFAAIGFAVFGRSGKVWLGTNVWFAVLGFLAIVRAWGPLKVLGYTFQESGGFVATACIGAISCVVAPGSFIGAAEASPRNQMLAICLAAIAALAAVVSYLNQGNRIMSIMLPIVLFSGATYWLRRDQTDT